MPPATSLAGAVTASPPSRCGQPQGFGDGVALLVAEALASREVSTWSASNGACSRSARRRA